MSEDRRLRRVLRAGAELPLPEGLGEQLRAQVAERFPAPRRSHTALVRLAVAAAVVLLVAGTLLRPKDVLAAAIEATRRARTAYIVEDEAEIWIDRDRGIRRQYKDALTVETAAARWEYYPNKQVAYRLDGNGATAAHDIAELTGLQLMMQAPRDKLVIDRKSEELLDGNACQRLSVHLELDPKATTTAERDALPVPRMRFEVWIDIETDRVVRWSGESVGRDGQHVAHDARVRYDVDLDPRLFEFTPPAGTKVIDGRIAALAAKALRAAKSMAVHEVGDRLEQPELGWRNGPFEHYDRWSKVGEGFHENLTTRELFDDMVAEGRRRRETGSRERLQPELFTIMSGGTGLEHWSYCARQGTGWLASGPAENGGPYVIARLEELLEALPVRQPGPRCHPWVHEADGRWEAQYQLPMLDFPGAPSQPQPDSRTANRIVIHHFDIGAGRLYHIEVCGQGDERIARPHFDMADIAYADELPAGILELKPPAGVRIEDRRNGG